MKSFPPDRPHPFLEARKDPASAGPEADLDSWTSLSARTGRSRSAPGDGGRLVGVVTKDALLRGIRGET